MDVTLVSLLKISQIKAREGIHRALLFPSAILYDRGDGQANTPRSTVFKALTIEKGDGQANTPKNKAVTKGDSYKGTQE